jgi:hypothetical protein
MAANTINLLLGGAIELILRPPTPVGTIFVTARYLGFTVKAEGNHMAYTLPVNNLIVVQVAYVDVAGNPAKVDGDVAWASNNDAVATAVVDPGDSTMCTVSAVGPIGTAQVTATADADLGDGVRELVTLLDLTVIAGEAVAGTINVVQEPQPIAPHAEPR